MEQLFLIEFVKFRIDTHACPQVNVRTEIIKAKTIDAVYKYVLDNHCDHLIVNYMHNIRLCLYTELGRYFDTGKFHPNGFIGNLEQHQLSPESDWDMLVKRINSGPGGCPGDHINEVKEYIKNNISMTKDFINTHHVYAKDLSCQREYIKIKEVKIKTI